MLADSLFLAATASGGATTEGSVSGLLFYLFIGLGFSFFCSILEAILLSSSLSHIEVQSEAGNRVGILMKRHKLNVEQSISAILTLNTIAHTVGAAGAGAQATALFGSQWFGLASAILTLLILVFSEIIPKTMGAVYWKPLLPLAAYGILGLVWVLYPIVWAMQRISRLLAPSHREPTITRSELEVLAEIGTGEGTLEEKEHTILRNLLRLSDVEVGDIMTPRTVVLMFQKDMTIKEVMEANPLLAYSRIPVFGENIDDVTGFVLRHQILSAAAEDKDTVKLDQLTLPIHSIPETLGVDRVLEEFNSRHEHIFLVLDEYGGTAGIITMEDAIESLLGIEITDESDVVEDLRTLAKQRYNRQIQLFGEQNPPSANGATQQPTDQKTAPASS